MNPLDVIPLMALISGVGLAIDASEVLAARAALAPAGLFSWDVLAVGRRYLVSGPVAAPLTRIFRYPAVTALPVVQLICSVGLLSAGTGTFSPSLERWIIACCAVPAAGARMLFYMRQQLGLDGADQMLVIVLLAQGFGAVFGNTSAGVAFTDYAALQLVVSYAISGSAKAVSGTWRSGKAITGITGTTGYGQAWLHTMLVRYPQIAKATCWSVITFECAALPLALLGHSGAVVIILTGLMFHVGVAITMGLNIFVWAFAACYPALWMLTSSWSLIH